MARESYDQSTDTHLAKKYNDALYLCIERCNYFGLITRSSPHFDNLIAYHAAVDTFFSNTYFLFDSVNVKIDKDRTESLSRLLINLSNEIDDDIRNMKKSFNFRTATHFHDAQRKISYFHKMIMFGLQQRQMLVRMSDREPRGGETIDYWNEKVGFKKGNILSDVERRKLG
jgi:hypothetical protein